jgi:hypothetical protein
MSARGECSARGPASLGAKTVGIQHHLYHELVHQAVHVLPTQRRFGAGEDIQRDAGKARGLPHGGAHHFVFVQNERHQDPIIVERLVRAPIRSRRKSSLKVGGLRIRDDVGIKVHMLIHLKLHAEMILAESIRGIVGSIRL